MWWPGSGPKWAQDWPEIGKFRVLDEVAMSRKSWFLEKTVNLSLFGEKPWKSWKSLFFMLFGQKRCFLTPKKGHFWACFGWYWSSTGIICTSETDNWQKYPKKHGIYPELVKIRKCGGFLKMSENDKNVINVNNYEIFITFVIFMCIIHSRLW